MPPSLARWLGTAALGCAAGACGLGGRGDGDDAGASPAMTTTAVDPNGDTVAASPDGRLQVTLPPAAFDVETSVTITEVEARGESPSAPDATIHGPVYVVAYVPRAAELRAAAFGLRLLPESVSGFGGAPSLATRPAQAGARRLDATWDPETGALTATASAFGAFWLEDACACNRAAACESACACDADCAGGCTEGQSRCSSGQCIAMAALCDGTADCNDGSDEDIRCDPEGADAFEPDDAAASPSSIAAGDTQARTLHVPGDEDWVRFELNAWAAVEVATAGPAGDTVLEVIDAAGNTLGLDDDGAGQGRFSRLAFPALAPGAYLVRVREHGGNATIAAYELSLAASAPGELLVPPDAVEARAEDGGIVVSWAARAGAAAYQVLYDDDPSAPFDPPVAAEEGPSPVAAASPGLVLTGLPAGAYYIGVATVGPDGAVSSPSPARAVQLAFGADAYEPDDELGGAAPVTPGAPQVRSLDVAGDVDVALFTLEAQLDVLVETSGPAGGDTVLEVYDGAARVAADDNSGGGSYARLVLEALPPGTYAARVFAYDAAATLARYVLTVATAPPVAPPQNLAVTPGPGLLAVTFDAVAGATSYRVYYDEAPTDVYDPWTLAAEGASPVVSGVASQTLSGLPAGVTVHVAVSASNGIRESALTPDRTGTPE